MYPEVAEAMVGLLAKIGLNMSYPQDQTCCGQPAFNSGYRKEAERAAKRFVRIFEGAQCIVCPSGSCVNMVRNHYPVLFQNDEKWRTRAKRVGVKTFELTEYLVDVLGIDGLGARFHGSITYHDSCHLLRGIGVSEQPRRLIRNVIGIHFIEMKASDRCCGFGGAFSVKYTTISSAMLDDKIENIMETGAEFVAGCDMGCLMNIQGVLSRMGSSIKVMHMAQLLDGASL